MKDSGLGSLRLLGYLIVVISLLAMSLPPKVSIQQETSDRDFNGDGYDDLAIGVPNEDVSGKDAAGAVNVIYGSSSGLSTTFVPDQILTQDTPNVADSAELRDNFGWSLAIGDFNRDGYADLAIGVRSESVMGRMDAGAVNVIYGSSYGLSPTIAPDGSGMDDQLWHQSILNVEGSSEEGDGFGWSLAAGDFNGDGFSDLAIGTPQEATTDSDTGSVNVLYGSASGLSTTFPLEDQFWTQNRMGASFAANYEEHFGWALSSGDFNNDGYDDLAIGVPHENVIDFPGVSSPAAGEVNVLYGSSSGLSLKNVQAWNQNSPGIAFGAGPLDKFGWSLTSADFNNDSYDDLAIGVPFEGTIPNRASGFGEVNVLYGSSAGLTAMGVQAWNQAVAGIEDDAEVDDRFALRLSSGDYNNDSYDDLAIGVPSESLNTASGTMHNFGAVNVIYGSAAGLQASGDQFWHQDVKFVDGTAEHGDSFGDSLASGDFNNDGTADLAIGVPLETMGLFDWAGAVNIIYGSPIGLSATLVPDQMWHQNTPGVEDSVDTVEFFGHSMAA